MKEQMAKKLQNNPNITDDIIFDLITPLNQKTRCYVNPFSIGENSNFAFREQLSQRQTQSI